MSTQFEQVKGRLDGTTKVEPNSLYLIDFTRLESVNDLVTVLAAIGLSIPSNHPNFEHVKRFLNLDNPIHLNQERPAESKEMNLPKLKKVK